MEKMFNSLVYHILDQQGCVRVITSPVLTHIIAKRKNRSSTKLFSSALVSINEYSRHLRLLTLKWLFQEAILAVPHLARREKGRFISHPAVDRFCACSSACRN